MMKRGGRFIKCLGVGLIVLMSLFYLSALPANAETTYFTDDFESGLTNWSVSGSDWALIDTDSVSPTHSVTDSPGGNYPPNANSTMTLAYPINLTGSVSPVLSFWYKISLASCGYGCSDYAYIEVSTDGGLSWTVLKSYTYGTVSTWTPELIDLSSYNTSSVLIRFRVRDTTGDGGADGWYIDDVKIGEMDTATLPFPFSDDLESGLTNWSVSGSDWALIDTDSVSPTHSVTDSPDGNYPPNANSTITLAHPIDLTGSVSPALSFWYKISLASCGYGCSDYAYIEISTDGGLSWTMLKSYTYGTVSTWTPELIDLSSYNTSSVLIRFRVRDTTGDGGADGWHIDDVEIKEMDAAAFPFPFTDDFESGLTNWSVSGSDWALIDTDSVSPTHSVTDSPDGNYPPNANSTMTLAHPIDLTGSVSPALSFWYKISLASCGYGCSDYAYIEVSADGGLSWTVLKSYTYGTVSTWTPELIDLSSYNTSSVLIRFRVRDTTGDGGADGWHIDDVVVKDLLNMPPVIDSFSATPTSGNNPLPVTFSCTAHDNDGFIAEYRWDFDGDFVIDQVTATGSTIYTYNEYGVYDAVCIAVDNTGSMGVSDPITISVGTDPVPDIKANGSDGPVIVNSVQDLSLTVELDPGSYTDHRSDWWILAKSSAGWYHYDLWCSCWKPDMFVTYLSPLFEVSTPYQVNMTLPAGSYIFYFGVDLIMNGRLEVGQTYYDSVQVKITQ